MKDIRLVGVAFAAALGVAAFAAAASASPVNGTGDLTSGYFNGSGVANGSFTGVNTNGLELALRAHLRYDNSGQAQNVFHYDNNDTYTFSPSEGNPPANRSIFNIDFSINTNSNGSTGSNIDAYTYLLAFDTDPGAGTSFQSFDPSKIHDNTYGTNAGKAVGGTASIDNVAQNSENLGFYTSNPQAPGTYTFTLSALNGSGATVASTSINVNVVPLPATLPLLLGAFGGFFVLRRKRRAA